MIEKTVRFCALFILVFIGFTPLAAQAQIKGQFSYEALADCEKPNVKSYPIKGSGTATLSTDKTATLSIRSGLSGYSRADVKLGEKSLDTKGNVTQLRVVGRNSLRATREYANNIVTAELKFVGQVCSIKIRHQLKPGKKLYTFSTPIGEALCTSIRVTKAECSAL